MKTYSKDSYRDLRNIEDQKETRDPNLTWRETLKQIYTDLRVRVTRYHLPGRCSVSRS